MDQISICASELLEVRLIYVSGKPESEEVDFPSTCLLLEESRRNKEMRREELARYGARELLV